MDCCWSLSGVMSLFIAACHCLGIFYKHGLHRFQHNTNLNRVNWVTLKGRGIPVECMCNNVRFVNWTKFNFKQDWPYLGLGCLSLFIDVLSTYISASFPKFKSNISNEDVVQLVKALSEMPCLKSQQVSVKSSSCF